MKTIYTIIATIIILIKQSSMAYAFFADEYKKQILYGAFKKAPQSTVYLSAGAGFLLKSWTPNLSTVLMTNPNTLSLYANSISEQMLSKATKGRYTYSINFAIGLHMDKSSFRHEIGFNWHTMASHTFALNDQQAVNIDNRNILELGVFANLYNITYNLYYNIENAFSILQTKWDFYIGAGAGIAIISGGTYIGKEVTNVTTVENEDGTTTTTNGPSTIENTPNINQVNNYQFHKNKSLGVACQGSIGVIANISQSFATSIYLKFEATSRPLLQFHSLSTIQKPKSAKTFYEYNISLNISLLIKAFEITM